jgi:vancomycin resistance protein YoaR
MCIRDSSQIGREVDFVQSLASASQTILRGDHTVPLTVKEVIPKANDTTLGSELGVTELVHQEISYYYGSNASRINNIKTAASRFHGLLVAPGEVLSMAEVIGDISLDSGFSEALIIFGNETIKGVGGGVCQVSTTLFRAAFFTGFPILERYAHAYRVGYYEQTYSGTEDPNLAGLDATVFIPVVDMKFKNDTPYWLLMETYAYDTYLQWKFYSTADGRSVEWETTGPENIVKAPKAKYVENKDLPEGKIKQIDWAAEGADITVQRTVKKDGQVYFTDSFYTHYVPWQAVYEYGPGTKLPKKASTE